MKRTLHTILGVVITGALLYGAYKLINFIFVLIRSLDSQVGAAVIAAAATIFGGLVINAWNQRAISRRGIQESHRQRKVELYKQFIDFYGRLAKEPIELPPEDEIRTWAAAFQKDLLMWGSRDVILEYAKFQTLSRPDGPGGPAAMVYAVDSLMRAMREDLGLSCAGIPKGGLISLWLRDPENLPKG